MLIKTKIGIKTQQIIKLQIITVGYFTAKFSVSLHMGAFTYDVRCFLGIFDLPTYPNQMIYYISLFSKIRCSLTYLPTQISDVICECSLRVHSFIFHPLTSFVCWLKHKDAELVNFAYCERHSMIAHWFILNLREGNKYNIKLLLSSKQGLC